MRLGLGIGLLLVSLTARPVAGGGGDTPVAGTLALATACAGSLTGLVGFQGTGNIACTFSGAVTGTLGFDPAAMSLGVWARADNYTAGTGDWTGQASAGSSGSRTFVQASAPARPAAGTAINGHVPADCDGTGDFVASSGFFITDLMSSTSGSCAVLVNVDSASAAAASPNFHQDRAVFADVAGRFGISVTTTGARAFLYNGTTRVATALVTFTTSTWTWMFAWYDATNLYFQVDGGTPVSVAKGGATTFAASQAARIGTNNTGLFDGRIAEVMTLPTAFTAAEILNILRYGTFRYLIPAVAP